MLKNVMNSTFAEALASGDPAVVAKYPKTDLHNHSMLGCRREDVEAFFGKPLKPFIYKGNGIHDVNRWITEVYAPVFRNPAAFRTALEATFRQAKSDGVSILEMSIDAGFGHLFGIPPKEIVATLKSVHHETAPEIDFRPELGFARPVTAGRLMEWFMEYLDLGYFRAIDLYDDESGQPLENLVEIYRIAKRAGLKCKAHAGEFGTPESVRETVEVLGLDAVQHGIAAARSKEVMAWLAERGIPLNICPTSNVIMQNAPSMAEHPIRVLYDHGVKVTVNSDDVILFGQSVSQEFLNLYRSGCLSADALEEIRLNGLSA